MCFLCVLHPGSQEVLEGSLEGPQKIHKQDYYIFLKVPKFVFTMNHSGCILLVCSLGELKIQCFEKSSPKYACLHLFFGVTMNV